MILKKKVIIITTNKCIKESLEYLFYNTKKIFFGKNEIKFEQLKQTLFANFNNNKISKIYYIFQTDYNLFMSKLIKMKKSKKTIQILIKRRKFYLKIQIKVK